MGISVKGGALTLNLFTDNGTDATSPRVYLLKNENTYEMFKMLNREIAYDVDVSRLGCGVNGTLGCAAAMASCSLGCRRAIHVRDERDG
jgi:cellulose 1,4-beta-cellobiosidase